MSPSPSIRLLMADDHPLMREGIAAVLARQPDMTVAGEAANGVEAVALHEQLRPDVTLMDLQMPRMDGLQAITQIRQRSPQARILVLTTYQGDFQAWRALKSGACGYLVKTAIRTTLVDAIRTAHGGGRWVPADVAVDLARHAGDEMLTDREIEVLRHIAQGHSNKEVGALLSVAEETIKARMKSILLKLNARDRTHAVTIAVQRGLIQL
ncbi:response regulator [Roseateles puraquae]|uniref:DNA-binding response regulator n=2 Tax=Pseudomonadota TaxID=1224 RepID=A0A254NDE8_9BURK|nr:response regulator transcription factor [Roseateles puraquae]MDG0854598.1 response regulator transcription factor [Roseateles puraquae]OWR05989.1 DNA-binding response regulator [Roseateles puraquae]